MCRASPDFAPSIAWVIAHPQSTPSVWGVYLDLRNPRFYLFLPPSRGPLFASYLRDSLRPIFESENDGPAPPTSPKLTGFFRLYDQNRPIARRLLELPDGLHFSEIWVYSDSRAIDSRTITDLVLKCSDTLETLHLSYSLSGAFPLVFAADWFLTTRYSRTQMITKRNLHLTSPTP